MVVNRKYDHKEVEKKWKKRWEETGVYKTDDSNEREKYYILDMYPYPSGAGLHVGHVEGYTATDIMARYARMNGKNVLHPMGWDAFGLPAENYAIKTGVHPKDTTKNATDNFREQIKNLGLSYDWDREIGSHLPEYYKWTQWFFLLLYKNKLAYKKKANVNWCNSCQTVLANEQVEDGKCERCKNEVVQKDLEQWFFKITEFANELVDDLDKVDWPNSTVTNQRNWIGRKYGINIEYPVVNEKGTVVIKNNVVCFTTRPDTNYGATFVVVAPDSEFVKENVELFPKVDEVKDYVKKSLKKTELDRISDGRNKTGVFTGWYAVNHLTKKKMPIYVADFVLGNVGTGCVVGVPGHDLRDFEFAQKMDLEIIRVVVGSDNDKSNIEIAEQVQEESGVMINSDFLNGMEILKAKDRIMDYIEENGWGKKIVNYKLRDWLVSRQRYWGAPIPIVYDPEGKPHPIPEEHLPWVLPTDVEFKPTGLSPLADSKELLKRVEDIFGKGWTPEVDTMDTFVCSSWYYFRFTDSKNDKEFANKEQIKKWMPVDLYVGGAEHTVLHLMYSRFFTKVLKKMGYIDFDEPFMKLRHQGMILAEDGLKMSKSLGNVINPDEMVEKFGADALRVYESFMGPFNQSCAWNTNGLVGCRKFLDKVWSLSDYLAEEADDVIEGELHKTIKKVSEDINRMKFNTAVSQMMIFVNNVMEVKKITRSQLLQFIKILTPFAPFLTEEMGENLIPASKDNNETAMLSLQNWPKYDSSKIDSIEVSIVIQVNGKRRSEIFVEKEKSKNKEIVLSTAKDNEVIKKYLNDKKVKREIFVPGRLVNLVV